MERERNEERKILIKAEGLKKYYPTSRGFFGRERSVLRAVDGVDLEICEGETFGLVGESGCGKSTLGRVLLRLIEPTAGRVVYQGEEGAVELTALPPKALRAQRKALQTIFQDPYASLDPKRSVFELIAEGARVQRLFKRKKAELRAYVLELAEKCGLSAHALSRYPHQFSGGQRQRVCIARALAVQPRFVVCDECVSALDVSVQAQILNLLSELKAREKLTYLFISHDLSVVRYFSDRIAVMYAGKIVERGSARQVFDDPRHPYTLSLLSCAPTEREHAQDKLLLRRDENPSSPLGCPFFSRCFYAQASCQRNPAPVVEVETGHFCACRFASDDGATKRARARKGGK